VIYGKCIFGHSDDQNIFLIYNLVLVHGSWLTAPKTLRISCNESDKGVFSYFDEMTCGKPLGNLRMGAGCQENQPRDAGLDRLVPPPAPGRGARLEIESISGQRFNQSCPYDEAPIKTQKNWVPR